MRRIAALAFGVIALSARATVPAEFAIIMPIETGAESAAWQVELDQAVYTWSQDQDLRDVLVFNADGMAVPMQAWNPARAADVVSEQRAEVPVLALPASPARPAHEDLRVLVERDADGRLRRIEAGNTTAPEPVASRDWLLDVAAFTRGIDRLHFNWTTPQTDVIARFAIEASDDLQRWRSVRDDASILLLQQDGARIERRQIELDGTPSAYLRVRRLDAGTALDGLRIDAIRQQREPGARAVLRWFSAEPVVDAPVAANSRRFDYALAAGVPVAALRIDLPSDNALAQLVLSAPATSRNGEPAWKPLANLVAYRLRLDGSVIDSGDLVLDTTPRVRSLRLEASAPISRAPRVEVGWRPSRIAFLAEGRGPFVIAAGHASVRRTDADLGVAMSALRATLGPQWQPPLATLGTAQSAAGAAAIATPADPRAWRRWLLWGVLIGAAALVSAIALSLLRGKR